ncbi:MAG: bifunctional folylpolyglutamate synthase/dihydrofolate synthase [Anaerolineae bacterium]|nr:MAG: bifunctional folylpolyglutamate synthase/dihydrofolate synthase [Anaerolineae bacterium]
MLLVAQTACVYNLPAMSDDLQARYQHALDYIYSFVDFSRTHQQNLSPENFDLSRMFALMRRLGEPQNRYPSLHIAGSKGKGSVAAFCAAALQAGGYRVGLYTSPHLKDFEERIQVDGQPIPRADLVALVEEIKPHVAAIPRLTTFEITTALGFLYFARRGVDFAVIEVGLGGRLDATNVITPRVAVITALQLEHTMILGDTLSQIAAEKGGIIKTGVPLVVAPQQAEALAVLESMAAERDAPCYRLGREYRYRAVEASLEGQTLDVWRQDAEHAAQRLRIPLLGLHQVENAALAWAALDVLRRHDELDLPPTAVAAGFERARWPARFEILQRCPPLVVDAAHTPAAMRRVCETLDAFFPDRPLWLVYGVSEDKDVAGMLRALPPRVEEVLCTRAEHPRALDAETLAERVRAAGFASRSVEPVGAALFAALEEAPPEAVILVSGSIFVAASARIAWLERQGELVE